MIKDVINKSLRLIPDERGRLLEILRADEKIFKKFGQVYLTSVYPGVIKGWHYHKRQIDNIVCVSGMVKLVLFDLRKDSITYNQINEFFIGEYNYALVQIPPMVAHGFKCISRNEALLLNIPDKVYNYKKPDEFRIPLDTDTIPYDWKRKDR
ncbi:MAG: dTDP-4-dehydrorhamnose 3,5-epimerase family protein [Candidatus Omnitrophota bacterium]